MATNQDEVKVTITGTVPTITNDPLPAGASGSAKTVVYDAKSGGNLALTTTLAAAVAKTTYLTRIVATAGVATAAALLSITTTGLATNLTFAYEIQTAVGNVAGPQLFINFDPPLPASAVNTAITVTFPAAGAGNTLQTLFIEGFQQ